MSVTGGLSSLGMIFHTKLGLHITGRWQLARASPFPACLRVRLGVGLGGGRGKWIGYGGYSTGAVDRRQRIEEGIVWLEAETPLTHECAGGVLWGGVSRGEVVE